MSTYTKKFEQMLVSKERELAKEIMVEAKRRDSLEDWLVAYLVEKTPVTFEEKDSSLEIAKECAEKAGASLLELAEAYRGILAKYEDLLVFQADYIAMVRPASSMAEEELKKFVLAFCDGRLFTSAQLGPHDEDLLPMIFMPIFFGGLQTVELSSIGVLWEYLDQAGPMAVNGHPIFFSLRIMNVQDWKRCLKVFPGEQKRRESLEVFEI